MSDGLLQDWAANKGNLRSCLVLAFFRIARRCHHLPPAIRWLGWPCLAAYTLIVEWVLGIEISYKASIGPGLKLYHGVGLVVHESTVMGKNCTLRQCTTIGNRKGADDVPVIGDDVEIGCNAVVIGTITIGSGAKIGAGSVVIADVAPGVSVAGNPARPVGRSD